MSNNFLIFLVPLAAVLLIAAPVVPMIKKVKSGKSPKGGFIFNLCSFFGLMLASLIAPVGNLVSAAAADGAVKTITTGMGLGYLAAALAVGLSCIGSGIAVAAGAPAAIGATSENPKSFVKSLIFVVLGEGIALYGLLISIMIISNLG